jgi:hypothetical protein
MTNRRKGPGHKKGEKSKRVGMLFLRKTRVIMGVVYTSYNVENGSSISLLCPFSSSLKIAK